MAKNREGWMVGVWEVGIHPKFFSMFWIHPKIIDVHPKLIPKGGVVQFCPSPEPHVWKSHHCDKIGWSSNQDDDSKICNEELLVLYDILWMAAREVEAWRRSRTF